MSELRRLRQMEEENAQLKRLVANLSLNKYTLSEALRKSLRPTPRRELAHLNVHQFASLAEAKAIIETWRVDYKQRRPHSSLGYLTTSECVAQSQRQQTVEETLCSS